MQFKNPELLYALFLLLIPIIVHLFQLRKFQKVTFTNVDFLKKLQLQTRKSAVIKKWLTLFTRLALLAALILAFAQPYFSINDAFNSEKETVIYLDNSFSMQAKGEKGELLKRAVQDLIETIPESEKVTLITNTDTYRNSTVKAIKNELLQLDYSASQLGYDAVLLKTKKTFSKNKSTIKNLILVSDFQQKGTTFNPETQSNINLNLVKLKPVNKNNTSIDSLYISKQNASNLELTVKLKNNGTQNNNLPVSLYNNGNLLSKASVNLKGETETVFTLPKDQIIKGIVTIQDASLQFDNSLYFNINSPSKLNVLAISDIKGSYLRRIFTEDEFNFTTKTTSTLDYSVFDSQNLIVLNETKHLSKSLVTALKVYTNNGGSVIFIPSKEGNLTEYNTFLQRFNFTPFTTLTTAQKRITSINYSHPIYENGVFEKRVSNFQYPKVNSYYPQINSKGINVLEFEDTKPFLSQKGSVFVFTAPINSDNSNFKNINLIVPTFYNIAKQSLNAATLYYTIGDDNSYDVSTSLKQDAILTLVKGAEKIIPEQNYYNNKVVVKTNDIPETAGVYDLKNKTQIIQNVSYNYNRNESNLNYLDLKDLTNVTLNNSVKDVFETIKNDTKVNELWKWFVILALVLLIIEMLILKYFK